MNRIMPLCLLTLMLAAAACGAQNESADEPATVADEPAQDEPSQGEPAQPLPPGHPAVSTPRSPADALPSVPAGAGTGGAALEWDVPQGWVAETPSSSMRRAQYRVPGAAGDGEAVVFYFGPGQGGGAEANAERWAGQFSQPDGRPAREAMTTDRIQVGDIDVLLVEATGTYSGGMAMGAPKAPLADAMLLGAIAEGADANWFFKVTGPRATLELQREAFLNMIRSLRPGTRP